MIEALMLHLTPTLVFLLISFVYLLLSFHLDVKKAVVSHMTVIGIMFGGMFYAVLVAA